MGRGRKSKGSVETPRAADTPQKNGFPEKELNGNGDIMEVDEPVVQAKPNKMTMKARVDNEVVPNKEVKGKDEKEETSNASGASMAVLLTQGLMANDAVKMDTVLRETNIASITATISDLNVVHVIPLLKALEHRLRNRGAVEIRPWVRWLQCIMSHHMSFLSSQRNLDKELGGLLEWMRARTAHHQMLFQIHGKLGVLVDLIERRTNNTLQANPQPLIVFNNDELNDSDIDELESLGSDESGASSEEEWWDDGEIREEPGAEDDEEDDDDDELDDSDEEMGGGRASGPALESDDDEEDDDEEEEEMDEN